MQAQDLNGRLYEADLSLQDIVSHYYHVYSAIDAAPVLKHLSPNLEMLMIFNFGPPVPLSLNNEKPGEYAVKRVTIIGPLRKMLNYELPPGADTIVVNFKLNGFYRVFKTPVDELTGSEITDTINLPHINFINELWQELAALGEINARLQLLDSYIGSLADENEEAVKPLLEGEPYFHDPVIQPVKAIAADTELTERSIQLRFKKYAGYSPKELLRFLRFKAVINHLLEQPADKIDIFDLIDSYNYHDQSHLIKDFNYFLGTTPQHFIKELKDKQFYVTGQGRNQQL